MGRLLSAFIVAAVISFPALVHAAGDSKLGDDEIRLKDGGMLRGTIVAIEPNKEATIVVKGKEKTIPWSKISKVEQGKYKNQGADEDDDDDEEEEVKPKSKKKKKKPAREEEEELTEPEKGAPLVHIQATYPNVHITRVEQVISVYTSRGSATGIVTRNLCTSPCDEIIDGRRGTEFFFTAPGMVPSAPFQLSQYDGEVEARVRGGSMGKRIGGVLVTSLGGALLLSGALFLALESSTSGILEEKPNYVPGGVMLGAGILGTAGGIYMIVTSKTTFDIIPRSEDSAGVRIENGVLRF